ncbi:TetR family transcriptional regulator [Mycolicibacterium madagascariense]|uniref:TetR family transcriptional regulator n=1 Tax=Mycolicibacterium madagascariense TaxID=212765 RepID=A0A7I7XF36_9MYCO|nr:TetR/AcrR family transcriptional regulator [Mycolicibacterium madagascariense]MCV7011264.1 TetR/AcrR family transcriptional regulator [Mycolicibacterium madagascariense]BBZ27795.1 TetR family transcriptional regulator [Mycolicibacterium madagascariense]
MINQDADTRAEITRQKIMDSAAGHFARRAFASVSVDEVIADTDVSKGALYFHFQSKHALARALVEHHAAAVRAGTMELLAHGGSGLETMVEITFMVATLDVCDVYARASANLESEVRRPGEHGTGPVDEWVKGSITVLEQAIADGDVRADCDPEVLAHVLVGHYVGMRQVSDLDDAPSFLTNVRDSWCTTLPGFASPDRLDYLLQFTTRRAAAAIRSIARG